MFFCTGKHGSGLRLLAWFLSSLTGRGLLYRALARPRSSTWLLMRWCGKKNRRHLLNATSPLLGVPELSDIPAGKVKNESRKPGSTVPSKTPVPVLRPRGSETRRSFFNLKPDCLPPPRNLVRTDKIYPSTSSVCIGRLGDRSPYKPRLFPNKEGSFPFSPVKERVASSDSWTSGMDPCVYLSRLVAFSWIFHRFFRFGILLIWAFLKWHRFLR